MARATGNKARRAMEPPHHRNSFAMARLHRPLEVGDVVVLDEPIHRRISQTFPEPPLLSEETVPSTRIVGPAEVVVEELDPFIQTDHPLLPPVPLHTLRHLPPFEVGRRATPIQISPIETGTEGQYTINSWMYTGLYETIGSAYEGAGFAFPTLVNDWTAPSFVHHQGFEILNRNQFLPCNANDLLEASLRPNLAFYNPHPNHPMTQADWNRQFDRFHRHTFSQLQTPAARRIRRLQRQIKAAALADNHVELAAIYRGLGRETGRLRSGKSYQQG